MLSDLKIDLSSGDLAIENGDLVLVSGADELVQLLRTRLLWFYGEYKFNTSLGVRYFEDILVKNPNIPNIETLLKNVIAETDGVNKIASFQMDYNAQQRTASISFVVDSVYGTLSLENLSLGV